MKRIDRDSAVPYYHQLKAILLARIEAEGLAGGDRFWSDNDVRATYGVSRSVVRQALAELETEGVITRVRGKGTFVTMPTEDHGLASSIDGLYAHARAQGLALSSRILRLQREPANERVAGLLDLEPGGEVVAVERVRHVAGEPWAYTTSWMPAELVPGIERFDFEEDSLYRILREEYGLSFGVARRSVGAVVAGQTAARHLHVRVGAPVLHIVSLLLSAESIPIETFVAQHRGDKSRFDVMLTAEQSDISVRITE
ncbi:MAG: GntR family transcriptional regulator [Actinomycetaceae bacterium]|nr:GntR family transcriptional regulator [Actinomycetaceae bacterium]